MTEQAGVVWDGRLEDGVRPGLVGVLNAGVVQCPTAGMEVMDAV